jgi:hypothetical protein
MKMGDTPSNVFGFVPVALVPFLQRLNLASQLDVELDVIVETGIGKVTRPNQGYRTDDI